MRVKGPVPSTGGGTTRTIHNSNFSGQVILGGVVTPPPAWTTVMVNGMTYQIGKSTAAGNPPRWYVLLVEVDAAV
jgi:hypothetical protein